MHAMFILLYESHLHDDNQAGTRCNRAANFPTLERLHVDVSAAEKSRATTLHIRVGDLKSRGRPSKPAGWRWREGKRGQYVRSQECVRRHSNKRTYVGLTLQHCKSPMTTSVLSIRTQSSHWAGSQNPSQAPPQADWELVLDRLRPQLTEAGFDIAEPLAVGW